MLISRRWGRLGIETRAEALKKGAPLAKNAEVNSALARLTSEQGTGMGKLFKAIAVADPKLGELPGFEKEPVEPTRTPPLLGGNRTG